MSSVAEHKRVLVVDDEKSVRGLLTSVLRQQSLHVDEAEAGSVAIGLLREHRYTVVLLDLLMPVANGFAVLDELRTATHYPPPVVLVLTGADRSVVDSLDSRSIHGIVRKPFDPVDVAALVHACSEIRSRSSLETMALAMLSGAPLFALLTSSGKI
jgi:DNA-binding response OmpR family regulator